MKIRRNPNQIILISVHLFMHRAGVGTSNRWKWNESKNWWCQPKTNRIMDSHGHWSRSSGCEIVQASTRVCICLSFSTFKKFQWNSNSLSNQTNEAKAKIWNKISHSRKSNWYFRIWYFRVGKILPLTWNWVSFFSSPFDASRVREKQRENLFFNGFSSLILNAI